MKPFEKFMLMSDGCECGCGHDHDEAMADEDACASELVLVDSETGEEHTFEFYDSFEFEGEEYAVLVFADDEDDNADEASEDDEDEGFTWVIMKHEQDENGEELFSSLDEKDEDRIYDAYEEILAESEEDEEE